MKYALHIVLTAFYASMLGLISLAYSTDLFDSWPNETRQVPQVSSFNWGEGSEVTWQTNSQTGK